MENLTDHSDNNTSDKKPGFFRRNAKTIKAVTIGILVLLLLIPMSMIESLIWERNRTEREAVKEVSNKWSDSQIITGPYLNFDYVLTYEKVVDGKSYMETETHNLTLLPDELNIDGNVTTETRKRGIYEINVYQSTLTLKGTFSPKELSKKGVDIEKIRFENATICLGITDMKGINEQVSITLGDSIYDFEPGINGKGIRNSGVSKIIDIPELEKQTIPYEISLKLKGSQSLEFTPIGKTTRVNIQSNWNTPSFDGKYLPESHNITDSGFTATWQVLNLNRSYPQLFMDFNDKDEIKSSTFGVNLIMPVEQYQQSTRTAKYAILIILLTFAVVFFVETINKKRIHVLQYLLIGLALCLFYTLLISISEQLNFTLAYIISSALTIGLITLYMRGIMKKTKPALIMGGLLLALYSYIYILIQLETLALLAGSLGLFAILAFVMYFSKKIDWFNE